MEGLQLTQYLYQRVDPGRLEEFRPFLATIQEFASYNKEYQMIEYHFDSQKYISLHSLLFLTSQNVVFVSDQQFCEISLKIIESFRYLQSQIKFHGAFKEENIWILTSKPLRNLPTETQFEVVFSGLFPPHQPEDDFKKIKKILKELASKIFPENWYSSILKPFKNDQQLDELENIFKEPNLQKQHPKAIESLQLEPLLSTFTEELFLMELGICFGKVLRANLLNFVVQTNKVKEFSQQMGLQQLFQQLKLSDLYNFIRKMIGLQMSIDVKKEQGYYEQAVLCMFLKYSEILNSLERLQKKQPKPENYQDMLHQALIRNFEQKETELMKMFPKSHKKLKSCFNPSIANFILFFQCYNMHTFVEDCNQVVKKELLKLYKENAEIDIQLIIQKGYSELDYYLTLFTEDSKKENIFLKYRDKKFTVQIVEEFRAQYLCTKDFVIDIVGQLILMRVKESYIEKYRQINEKIINKLQQFK